MKTFFYKLLPWHVRRVLMWTRYYFARRKPPFQGVYTHFGEVPGGSKSAGWHANHWTRTVGSHAVKARMRYAEASASVLPDNPQPTKALLPLVIAAHPVWRQRPLRVLDFGGGAGADFPWLLAALGPESRTEIRYHVVDMPEACAAGRDIWADENGISFSTEIPNAAVDIVVADGAIHMVEDIPALIAALAATGPSHMLFCKTSMHEGPAFVRRQVNMGPNMENPQWVLNFREFETVLRNNGYALTFRGYCEDSYNVDNYKSPHDAGRTVNLLFRRITTGA